MTRAVIHRYATVEGVYHAIQTDPTVQDGHLVVVPAAGEVAVVCGTFPVAVHTPSRLFPALPDPQAWTQLARGRYSDAAHLARCVAAGLATDPGDWPTVTGAGTFRAVYDRAYGWGMPGYQAQAIAALACELHGADLITALNDIATAKNEWFYGAHGHAVDRFYGSQPLSLPTFRAARRAG
jgi:hypothetical protein